MLKSSIAGSKASVGKSQKTSVKLKATTQTAIKAVKPVAIVKQSRKEELHKNRVEERKTVATVRLVSSNTDIKSRPELTPSQNVTRVAQGEKKPAAKSANSLFGVGSYVVYPTHGVGRVTAVEKQMIGGHELSLYVIAFERDKMTLRVPVSRAQITGLRALSDGAQIERAISTLKQKAKVAKGMWSKRAQEYESKINSGNILYLAEVVRDLHRNVDHPERSYSERIIYENAFNRLAREIAAAQAMDQETATDKLNKLLSKKAA